VTSRRRWSVFLATTLLVVTMAVGAALLIKLLWNDNVPEPGPHLPSGFKAAAEEVVPDHAQKKYYRKITLALSDRPALTFVLIQQKTADDLPTYYIQESKVSYEQFGQFARANPQAVRGEWASNAARALLPALGMTLAEATALAQWVGGKLPTTRQWDKAAGLYDRQGRDGPAKGPRVAVGLRGHGPRPLSEASDDISPLGVRELAGNGYEFTRDLLEEEGTGRKLVILRGQKHTAARPLRFEDLERQRQQPLPQLAEAASPLTGFRIVVEPE
jgi:hypothetical protein